MNESKFSVAFFRLVADVVCNERIAIVGVSNISKPSSSGLSSIFLSLFAMGIFVFFAYFGF